MMIPKQTQNLEIVQRVKSGESIKNIALDYGLKDVTIEALYKKHQDEEPHWTDALSCMTRSNLLRWAKKKGLDRLQLQKQFVIDHILNNTFYYPHLRVVRMKEICQLLEIVYEEREI